MIAAAGCAAGPIAQAPGARVAPAADWNSFVHSDHALGEEIARRAEELRSGPVGNRAFELASLRLAASGRDLVESGSSGGAERALERAISLWSGNGYAYLYLAYVMHTGGNGSRAAELASSAAHHLPRDAGIRSELEGLRGAIEESASVTTGGHVR